MNKNTSLDTEDRVTGSKKSSKTEHKPSRSLILIATKASDRLVLFCARFEPVFVVVSSFLGIWKALE